MRDIRDGRERLQGRKKLEDPFGSLCKQYPLTQAGKENHCGRLCSTRASGSIAAAKTKAAGFCSKLGAGSFRIQYCSHVGDGAIKNDPDATVGKLNCAAAQTIAATCACPAGFTQSGKNCVKPALGSWQ